MINTKKNYSTLLKVITKTSKLKVQTKNKTDIKNY